MPNQSDPAPVFHAMGDRTRLAILAALAAGPRTVSELSRGSAMALPSFLQHLRVLEGAALVASEKRGRVRTCRLRPETLGQAQAWIAAQRSLWEARLEGLDGFIAERMQEEDRP